MKRKPRTSLDRQAPPAIAPSRTFRLRGGGPGAIPTRASYQESRPNHRIHETQSGIQTVQLPLPDRLLRQDTSKGLVGGRPDDVMFWAFVHAHLLSRRPLRGRREAAQGVRALNSGRSLVPSVGRSLPDLAFPTSAVVDLRHRAPRQCQLILKIITRKLPQYPVGAA
jgi:hypothetical protein